MMCHMRFSHNFSCLRLSEKHTFLGKELVVYMYTLQRVYQDGFNKTIIKPEQLWPYAIIQMLHQRPS
jgi:hypothetical protein